MIVQLYFNKIFNAAVELFEAHREEERLPNTAAAANNKRIAAARTVSKTDTFNQLVGSDPRATLVFDAAREAAKNWYCYCGVGGSPLMAFKGQFVVLFNKKFNTSYAMPDCKDQQYFNTLFKAAVELYEAHEQKSQLSDRAAAEKNVYSKNCVYLHIANKDGGYHRVGRNELAEAVFNDASSFAKTSCLGDKSKELFEALFVQSYNNAYNTRFVMPKNTEVNPTAAPRPNI